MIKHEKPSDKYSDTKPSPMYTKLLTLPIKIPIPVNLTYHDKKGAITSCKLLLKLLLKIPMLQIKYNQAFKKNHIRNILATNLQ